ncbi:MAG: hypothetical protein ACP5RJ_03885 [Conexivisphaera sp.]
MQWKDLGSKLLDFVSIDGPFRLLAASAVLALVLYLIGIPLYRIPVISSKYPEIFPAASAILFALSIYGKSPSEAPRHNLLKMYLAAMLMSYATIAAVAAPPGFYTAMASPSTVSQFVNEVETFRSTYTTLPAMSFAIFTHNLEIDLLSYIPVAGAALFGFSMMGTSSLVWAAGASSMMAGNQLWYAYVLSVLLAPSTFTEFSSYAIAVVGGYTLYHALTAGDRRGIWISLALLAASVALLYASAMLEAWLILYVGA